LIVVLTSITLVFYLVASIRNWRPVLDPMNHSCSCHPNEILKIRSPELNATCEKQGFRTKDMHVITAEILNGHNKILIDNIASELIVLLPVVNMSL
jgi:hypothetical protein